MRHSPQSATTFFCFLLVPKAWGLGILFVSNSVSSLPPSISEKSKRQPSLVNGRKNRGMLELAYIWISNDTRFHGIIGHRKRLYWHHIFAVAENLSIFLIIISQSFANPSRPRIPETWPGRIEFLNLIELEIIAVIEERETSFVKLPQKRQLVPKIVRYFFRFEILWFWAPAFQYVVLGLSLPTCCANVWWQYVTETCCGNMLWQHAGWLYSPNMVWLTPTNPLTLVMCWQSENRLQR